METPKIMSVERAIQRELAYRRKMEALQFGLHNASSSVGISFQDSGHSSISGTKRKSPYIDAPAFPLEQQPHPQPLSARPNHHSRPINFNAILSCILCKEYFPNAFYLDRHRKGTKHKTMLTTNRHSRVIVSNPFTCQICQVTGNWISLEMHLFGRRHKQALEDGPSPNRPRDPQIDIANLTWDSV